jgi:pseudaminic acid synthase
MKITNKLSFNFNERPKIIAEISGNHEGSKKKFLKLIKSAFENGADIVKIQTYEPKDITLKSKDNNFYIKNGIWKNKHLWDLYSDACTPFSWHKDAFKLATKLKKVIFSSPFSLRGVDLLEKLKVKMYKIASFEITDMKLVRYIASKKKPIIISTGMASKKDINTAIKEIRKFHNKIVIMHCVSDYPTILENTNLKNIKKLKKNYKKNLIGLSDHTNDIISSLVSIPIGVVAIEKHFKLSLNSKSHDSTFSIIPSQLKKLRTLSEKVFMSLNKKNLKSDKINIKLRRSIFSTKKILKGELITINNIDTFRPNIGIDASKYFDVLGKSAKKIIKAGSPIKTNDII